MARVPAHHHSNATVNPWEVTVKLSDPLSPRLSPPVPLTFVGDGPEVEVFHLLSGPRRFSQKREARLDAGV